MRICVVSHPRSGSTTLCRYLAQIHNLNNVGEVYRSREAGMEILTQANIIFKLVPQNAFGYVMENLVDNIYTKSFIQHIIHRKLQNSEFRKEFSQRHSQLILKNAIDICKKTIDRSDKVYFLCRNDRKSQILSFAAMLQGSVSPGRNRNDELIKINDDILIFVRDIVYKLYGDPIFDVLKNHGPNELIYTEELPKITGTAPYPNVTYIYNESLLVDGYE